MLSLFGGWVRLASGLETQREGDSLGSAPPEHYNSVRDKTKGLTDRKATAESTM